MELTNTYSGTTPGYTSLAQVDTSDYGRFFLSPAAAVTIDARRRAEGRRETADHQSDARVAVAIERLTRGRRRSIVRLGSVQDGLSRRASRHSSRFAQKATAFG